MCPLGLRQTEKWSLMVGSLMNRRNARPFELLLVEDNVGDVRLLMEALSDTQWHRNLSVVEDGEQALLFVRRQPPYQNAPRPDLILLDLNLPRKDGRQVLAEIKGEPTLRAIPVLVLTTSHMQEDIDHAYSLHANGYITKPADFASYSAMVEAIAQFWMGLARLPAP
jgi:two-component system, chemotaxis family, response regulator Rcp1